MAKNATGDAAVGRARESRDLNDSAGVSSAAHGLVGTTEARPGGLDVSADGDEVRVRGARVHNLKNIDVTIPHNAITVVTGVSGSGKSSLAFDTLYAEGQRRYIESLSAYARQFLERIEKPDVDEITGIAPAISIRQKNTTRNPRSTVATATEIYDYMRLLFARVGHTFCLRCGEEVRRDTMDEIAERVLAVGEGKRFYVLYELKISLPAKASTSATRQSQQSIADSAEGGESAPALKPELAAADAGLPGTAVTPTDARKTRSSSAKRKKASADAVREALVSLRKRGFNRLYQGGRVFEFATPEDLLDVDFAKPVHVLVDRLALSAEVRSRLMDSIEICYREGGGEAILQFVADDGSEAERLVFNERFDCKKCGASYQEPEPRLFSFNNPYGACPRCQGFGNTIDFDIDRVIPDKSKSLASGAIEPWTKPRYRQLAVEMRKFARAKGIPADVPFRNLTPEQRDAIIEGDADSDYPGVKGFFGWLERKKYKLHVRVFLSRYRGYATCPDCNGTRLRAEARAVKVNGKSITEVCQMTVKEARPFFDSLTLSSAEAEIADKVLIEIQQRLRFLDEVGLEYLTLDRLTSTLSGGEAQRIQLATSLGSHLVGALYVLDEPSIGLHPRDTNRLIDILKGLRDLGNTLVVVEHDPDTILAADHVLDLGPGAGEHGGAVMFAGAREALLKDSRSLTGRYLRGDLKIAVPQRRRRPQGKFLKIEGARSHNLQGVSVMIPLNLVVAITGVSGSGKSTLVYDVLYKALQAKRTGGNWREFCDRIEGDSALTAIEMVDQSPIGRTPRSNPATYLKAFDPIREVFASTPQARKRGFSSGDFSFNIEGGRCEACQGDGTVTVEMRFLADVELVCEECRGTRYKSSVLEVLYHGKNIHDVLQMTVREALTFFAAHPKVTSRLRVLEEVGLGYLRLGQSGTTLSGGEAQRLKLAAHLTRQENEGILYIFDEPTTGLHFDDIQKLLTAFRKLIEGGASVLIIEHNLDMIKSADWIIDLGPEGGDAGGRVVAAGTPEQVARNSQSHTGRYLAAVLSAANGNHKHAQAAGKTPRAGDSSPS
ncbi:MAG TPA: excinuclease ABC subunit UvrA [Candidatus Acidoferrales bacterium]|nr:excinuclease ABC subunit UvrA [Candidatus Acidoferrales bacterium]